MIRLGSMNALTLLRRDDKGGWLDAEDFGEILLPMRQLPRDAKPGSAVKVFVYLDGDEELVVTGFKPYAQVGEFVGLKVVSASRVGAFLDWGLKKDLFVPAREQAQAMQVDKHYVVYLYLDREGRVAATSKLDRFLDEGWPEYKPGDAVSILPCEHTPLGIKAVVDSRYWGVLYRNELFGKVTTGRETRGFIKQVREDGKIDLTLNQPGQAGTQTAAEKIMARLQKQDGFLPVGDKSSPEVIYQLFTMSKGTFKKAIGALYKQGQILIEDEGIRLVKSE
ncbi:MAG: nucleotide-binding protein [Aeromonadaceae bacterium]|nr:nucleotide-binding protein [Aeromonadaceae bacterium]